MYNHFDCFKQLVQGGADLCLPPAVANSGFLPLVQGILRYKCDLRYMKLLVLSGGVRDVNEVSTFVQLYRSTYSAKVQEECMDYLVTMTSKDKA